MILAARTMLLLTTTVILAPASFAQVGGIAPGSPTNSPGERGFTCNTSRSIRPPSVLAGPTVAYSAVREFSGVQTLGDGTHIAEPTSQVKEFRDSEGRMRTERPICPQAADDPEGVLIEIHDPVSGLGYFLDVQNRTAYKFEVRVRQPSQRPAANPNKAAPQSAAKIVVPSADSTRPKETEESLGTQTIEGISVEGLKMTEVIATGAQGNDRPVTIINEMWTSPELKITVLSKRLDPFVGEQTVRLTNIDTSEPSPLLFQPPPDYKIVDAPDRVKITYKRP